MQFNGDYQLSMHFGVGGEEVVRDPALPDRPPADGESEDDDRSSSSDSEEDADAGLISLHCML